MARGRMIDKRISRSKKLGKVSDKAKVLYFMLYPHLDCEGRIAFDDLEDLKDEIMPKFKNWSFRKIADGLNELADIELIQLYPDNKKIAMEFDKFEEFQTGMKKDREAPSKISSYGVAQDNSGVFRITPSLSLKKYKEGKKEGISFSFEKKKFLNITDEDIKGWSEAYPKCDIKLCLLQMGEWLLSDPKRKKSNYRRFITNWLKKEQDQGGTKGSKEDWKKKRDDEAKKIEESEDA